MSILTQTLRSGSCISKHALVRWNAERVWVCRGSGVDSFSYLSLGCGPILQKIFDELIFLLRITSCSSWRLLAGPHPSVAAHPTKTRTLPRLVGGQAQHAVVLLHNGVVPEHMRREWLTELCRCNSNSHTNDYCISTGALFCARTRFTPYFFRHRQFTLRNK